MTATYTAKDITVLEGLEPVRKRPGMYIGGVGSAGLHHLVWEVLDNAVDEAMNGHATEIVVTLHDDGASVTVSDNGRGIPIDRHPVHKKSALEIIFTTLHAGGKVRHVRGDLQDLRGPTRCWGQCGQRPVEEAGRQGASRRWVSGSSSLLWASRRRKLKEKDQLRHADRARKCLLPPRPDDFSQDRVQC